MNKQKMAALAGASVSAIAILATTPAAAQVEEIFVSAQRREQNLQDVPISVSAYKGDDLRRLEIDSPTEIGALTPGFMASGSRGDSNPIFSIRGIGLNDLFTNNNPTVGVYVDEIMQPYTPLLGFQMFDIERVEVLKGPQGTLYGRNTTGGAVNFVTVKPSDELSGYAQASYSRFGRAEVEGAIGGPVTDTLAVRVSGKTTQQTGGWQYNTLTGEQIGDINRSSVRGQVLWTPTDNFDALFKADYYTDDSDQQLRQHMGYASGAFSSTPCQGFLDGIRDEGNCVDFLGYFDPGANPRKVENSSAYGHKSEVDAYDFGLTMNWDLGGAKLTSVTGYTSFERAAGDDSDGGGLIELDTLFSDDISAVSQEIRLSSVDSGPLTWVVGGFFSHDDLKGSALQALDDHIFHTRVDTSYRQKSSSYAAFGQADWAFADRLTLTAGLRYTYEKKSIIYDGIDLDPDGISTLPTPVAGIDDSFHQDNVSGKIGLNFDLTDNVMLYASASKGFKSGGYKAAIAFNPDELQPFLGENLYAYEVGAKSTLLDGALNLNVAGYYYDWKNFQAYVTEIRSGINVIVLSNAGDARVYGAEASANFRPNDRVSLQLSANLMDTEIRKFNTVAGTTDNTGNQLAYAPEFSFSGVFRYDLPVEAAGFKMYVLSDASYRDQVYFSLANRLQNSQSGYWLAGARLAVTTMDERWELAVWGKNLTDKYFVTLSYDNFGGIFPSSNFLGDPRTYGVTMSYRF